MASIMKQRVASNGPDEAANFWAVYDLTDKDLSESDRVVLAMYTRTFMEALHGVHDFSEDDLVKASTTIKQMIPEMAELSRRGFKNMELLGLYFVGLMSLIEKEIKARQSSDELGSIRHNGIAPR